jgi:hypothetical protein
MAVLFMVGLVGVASILAALAVDLTMGPGPLASYRRVATRDALFLLGTFLAVGAFVLAGTVAFIQSFAQ